MCLSVSCRVRLDAAVSPLLCQWLASFDERPSLLIPSLAEAGLRVRLGQGFVGLADAPCLARRVATELVSGEAVVQRLRLRMQLHGLMHPLLLQWLTVTPASLHGHGVVELAEQGLSDVLGVASSGAAVIAVAGAAQGTAAAQGRGDVSAIAAVPGVSVAKVRKGQTGRGGVAVEGTASEPGTPVGEVDQGALMRFTGSWG